MSTPTPADLADVARYLREHAATLSYDIDRATARGDDGLALGLTWRREQLCELITAVETWTVHRPPPLRTAAATVLRTLVDVLAA